MQEFFNFFANCWIRIINLLGNYYFPTPFGDVSLWSLIVALFFLGFVITIFYKGAKT